MKLLYSLIILLLSCSLLSVSFGDNYKVVTSVGMSETMGYHALSEGKVFLNENIFLSVGTSLLFGGVAAGLQHTFIPKLKISPFISSAIFRSYMVPLMCQSCKGLVYETYYTGAFGLSGELFNVKILRPTAFGFKLGLMSYLYSPTDIEAKHIKGPVSNQLIRPFLNINITMRSF